MVSLNREEKEEQGQNQETKKGQRESQKAHTPRCTHDRSVIKFKSINFGAMANPLRDLDRLGDGLYIVHRYADGSLVLFECT
jgi:hypothetical protein